jgi:PPK2 family polyphosphate:nucleotide phosphotransferase
MENKIRIEDFHYRPGHSPQLADHPYEIPDIYENKDEYRDLMEDYMDQMQSLQSMMYAHDRYSLLLIFQGMDTSGKDGTIKHVMSGINVAGVQVYSFKRPSEMELEHDWMWRTTCCLPERGRIGIFNRSYYEEVVVVKVHPEILHNVQRIPHDLIKNDKKVFEDRYKDINNFEDFQYRNGCRIIKFFMNISKDEQKDRLLERIEMPEKNWKMSLGDVEERKHWEKYMQAYQDLLDQTSTDHCPWYVIPANDKKNARLIVSRILLGELKRLDMHFPIVTKEFKAQLEEVRTYLEKN